MQLVVAFALALCVLCILMIRASFDARQRLVRVYETLASQWRGHVVEGSFFHPPALHYDVAGMQAELSAFYLRRDTLSAWLGRLRSRLGRTPVDADRVLPPHGSRPGHYTQLRFHLDRRVIESFVINADSEAPTGYRVESLQPELPERLLEKGWAKALRDIEAIRDRGSAHVRFDGDTLTVRKAALLMVLPNVEAFAVTGARLFTELTEALGDRGVRIKS